jgi:predicted small lipoprotein YifL
MRVACIMLLFSLFMQGCGHKGPLILPQSQPSVQKSSAQPSADQPSNSKQ